MAVLFTVVLGFLVRGIACSVVQRTDTTTGISLWPLNPEAKWNPNTLKYDVPRVIINYIRDTNEYSLADFSVYTKAMQTVNIATKNCIRFEVHTPSAANETAKNIIHLRSTLTTSTPKVCKTINGYAASASGAGQVMLLFGASAQPDNLPGGCLNSERDTVRIFMNVLGVVNEYQRTDRDAILTIDSSHNAKVLDNLQPENLFAVRTDVHVLSDFDVNSVTMVSETKYAKNPQDPVFAFQEPETRVPTSAKLSYLDCLTLSYLYDCQIECEESSLDTTPGFTPERLAESFNCWPPSQNGMLLATGGEFGTKLQLATADDITSITYTVSPANPNLRLRLPPTSAGITVALSKRISNQLSTTLKIVGKKIIGGALQTIATGEIAVEVNCLPQFFFDGIPIPCPERAPGTRELTCTTDLSRVIPIVQCKSANHFPDEGFILGRFEARDPDGGEAEWISLRVSRVTGAALSPVNADETSSWTITSGGQIIWTGDSADLVDLGPEVRVFTVQYFDAQVSRIVKSVFTVALKCHATLLSLLPDY